MMNVTNIQCKCALIEKNKTKLQMIFYARNNTINANQQIYTHRRWGTMRSKADYISSLIEHSFDSEGMP